MSGDDYAPFPAEGLEQIAASMEEAALLAEELGAFSGIDSLLWNAGTCRSAIASYKALNERCLRAELERDHGVKA